MYAQIAQGELRGPAQVTGDSSRLSSVSWGDHYKNIGTLEARDEAGLQQKCVEESF